MVTPYSARNLKVFIGSSSEPLPMAIVDHLVDKLSQHNPPIEVHPWKETITPGQYALVGLIEEADRVDAAIFIFARDDEIEFRGESGYSTRSNVLLEYGMFVDSLGMERVLILEEDGVNLPTDILGITTHKFRATNRALWQANINTFVNRVVPQWQCLPVRTPRKGPIEDAELGYATTIRKERFKLHEITGVLAQFAVDGRGLGQNPITFGSQSAPISAYTEALTRVQHRFWTTTFLSSGFWTQRRAEVLAANDRMLNRLRENGGHARRLFLLDQPASMVRQAYGDHRILQRQLHRSEELKRLDSEHDHLKQNVDHMVSQGFEVRVVFDSTKAYTILPEGLVTDANDSELTIYDDFRIDVFEGGKHGLIHSVTSHSRFLDHFDSYLNEAVEYFDRLWDKAQEMEKFISELEQTIVSAGSKIDYEPNWLAMYEYLLPKDDERIKTLEFGRVKEVLRDEIDTRGMQITRYLDVGTCTGRYPIGLRNLVSEDGHIIGIDEDYDCVRFAAARVQQECPDDRRIAIHRRNFVAPELDIEGPFDVITCMLGTLSHFGWDRDATEGDDRTYEDSIQTALDRMSKFLSREGLLFLGTWSDYACRSLNMLGIYRQEDLERLAKWTPSRLELKDRLTRAGLIITGEAQVDQRLDLTWCRRASLERAGRSSDG